MKIRETGARRQHRYREGAGVLSVHMGKRASGKQQEKKKIEVAKTEGKGEGVKISGRRPAFN